MGSQWDSIVKGRYAYTVGTLFYHANHAQPDWREAEPNQPGHVDDGGQHERQNLIQTSGDFVAISCPLIIRSTACSNAGSSMRSQPRQAAEKLVLRCA